MDWKTAPVYLCYSDYNHYENWDYDNPDTKGIGGSETNQIEWAWRLARRGWDVTSFSPTDWTGVKTWRNVKWQSSKLADYSKPGIWLLYRDPQLLDHFPHNHPDQKLILVAQDTYYPQMTEDRGAVLDHYICLCQDHLQFTAMRYPYLANKLWMNSNGSKVDLIRSIEKENIPRNPHKMIFASSPDRGLLNLLPVFRRAREWVSDLELHIFYGFDNIDKSLEKAPSDHPYRIMKQMVITAANQPGVFLRGRVDQQKLIREWFSSGIWCHPSSFTETSCITSMDAQCCGAIPIATPVWAVSGNVMHGSFIPGEPTGDMTQKRFVGEIFRWASNLELQESVRPIMMAQARCRFNWERSVDLLEAYILGYARVEPRNLYCQNIFALKHSFGSILNVGCCDDSGDLKAKGAVNIDLHVVDPALDRPNKADIVMDARDLPGILNGHKFDSITCTEMLEHYETKDVPAQLVKFRKMLKPGGKLIFTVPDDYRERQGLAENGYTEYAKGIGFKHKRVSHETIVSWLNKSHLRLVHYEPIEYGWGEESGGVTGHGVVAEAR